MAREKNLQTKTMVHLQEIFSVSLCASTCECWGDPLVSQMCWSQNRSGKLLKLDLFLQPPE
jgi:hypothetical protein